MRRRRAIQSLLGLPAITAIPAFAQQEKPKLPPELKPPAVQGFQKLAMTRPDAAAACDSAFFTGTQFANLRRLCAALVPAVNGKPGAVEAGVPEFLDFLIGRSPVERQKLYREGLDDLEVDAQQKHRKSFAEIGPSEADALLEPLRATVLIQTGRLDMLPAFLFAAKEDALHATLNSREWAAASTGRRAGGLGTYWYPVE